MTDLITVFVMVLSFNTMTIEPDATLAYHSTGVVFLTEAACKDAADTAFDAARGVNFHNSRTEFKVKCEAIRTTRQAVDELIRSRLEVSANACL